MTGFATIELSLVGKMLQTLKEITPNVAHVSMIYNPDNPAGPLFVRQFESVAGPLGVKPIIAHVHGLADIEHAAGRRGGTARWGHVCPLGRHANAFMEQTVATIARHRLPAIYSERAFVTSGGLVYYGTDRLEQYRGAASYVDRILRGEKAGDLPFQLAYPIVLGAIVRRSSYLSPRPFITFR